MKNFPTKYNEIKNINDIKNVWELYFKQISKYKLSEVYKSKNVIICSDNLPISLNDFKNKNLNKTFEKLIKINKKILNETNTFYKKYFTKHTNIIGIHLRGTDQKVTPNHHLPPAIFDIFTIIEKKISSNKRVKFFIITEQKKYLDILKKKYHNKIIYFNSFRANSIKEFNFSKRKFHRNKLGLESLKESIILSHCEEIYYCKSNIPLFSILLNNKIKISNELYNGINAKNQILACYKWYVTVLPVSFAKYLLFKLRSL